jgi:hypothetical protein
VDLFVNMLHLLQYISSNKQENSDNARTHMKPFSASKSTGALQNKIQVCSIPDVLPAVSSEHN